MKVVVISGALPPHKSGEATNTYFLCKNLAQNNVEVQVLTNIKDFDHIPEVQINAIMKNWGWLQFFKLMRFLLHEKPDAVILMYLGGIYDFHPMITFVPTFIKRFLSSTIFVTRFENVLGSSNPASTSFMSRLIRKLLFLVINTERVHYNFGTLLRDSDKIIILCDYHKALLKDCDAGIDHKFRLIPPPSNLPVVEDSDGILRGKGRQLLGVDKDVILVGYMGYVYPNKGVNHLLNAFNLVLSNQLNLTLLIMGGSIGINQPGVEPGYYEKMKDLAVKLGISDSVKWTGGFSYKDPNLPANLYSVDIWVFPFDNGIHLNNSSFASIASYGGAIITTKGDFVEDVLIHRENVFLVEPKKPEALAQAIIELAENESLRQHLSKGILKLNRDLLSWDAAIRNTMNTMHSKTKSKEFSEYEI